MKILRYPDALLPTVMGLGYVVLAYLAALLLLAGGGNLGFLPAVILLAHALVIAAYFLHECIHQAVFSSTQWNNRLGMALAWLVGGACSPYPILREKHLRHHGDRMDVLSFDADTHLQRYPWLLKLFAVLQWLHIPVVDIYSRWLSVAAPFIIKTRSQYRTYSLAVLGSRVAYFAVLGVIDVRLVIGHGIAWLVSVAVLGFMDTFQHDYSIAYTLEDALHGKPKKPEFGRDYEESHTCSNLLSRRYPLLNMLVLNFCYHNVHHRKSAAPWYRLPALHASTYPEARPEIPFREQLANYHRYRSQRFVGAGHPDHVAAMQVGSNGVSFVSGV